MPSSKPSDFEAAAAVPIDRLRLIADSYRRLTGRELIEGAGVVGAASAAISLQCKAAPEDLRRAMWETPRAIVAHGTEDDPVFFYGNRVALELFEMNFADFTRLPSRYSAEPLARDERERLLERVSRMGFIDDYSGVRISGNGKRFKILAATVWNLVDEAGNRHGQAATFSHWVGL